MIQKILYSALIAFVFLQNTSIAKEKSEEDPFNISLIDKITKLELVYANEALEIYFDKNKRYARQNVPQEIYDQIYGIDTDKKDSEEKALSQNWKMNLTLKDSDKVSVHFNLFLTVHPESTSPIDGGIQRNLIYLILGGSFVPYAEGYRKIKSIEKVFLKLFTKYFKHGATIDIERIWPGRETKEYDHDVRP